MYLLSFLFFLDLTKQIFSRTLLIFSSKDLNKAFNNKNSVFLRSGSSSSIYNNCLISDDNNGRSFDGDLERNIAYDVYEFTGHGKNCRADQSNCSRLLLKYFGKVPFYYTNTFTSKISN
jgi:hypothetical protein